MRLHNRPDNLGGKSMPQPDSIQVNYVREFTRLSLWYIHKRLREEESNFEDAMNVRVNVYRNTR